MPGVNIRRVFTAAVANGQLPLAEAFLLGPVIVPRIAVPAGKTGRGERVRQRVQVAREPRGDGAVAGPLRIRATFSSFLPAKIRQHLGTGLASQAGGNPVVGVTAIAAHVGHGVYGRVATHNLPAGALD